MVTDVILRQKAGQWHESSEYIQSVIANYSQEEVGAFEDLLMAVTATSVKQMFLTEKCKILSTFANQISVKDSKLSMQVNTFVGICESIYSKPEKFSSFKRILQEEGWIRKLEQRKKEEDNYQKEQERIWREEQQRRLREKEEQQRRIREEEERKQREEELRQQRWREQQRQQEQQKQYHDTHKGRSYYSEPIKPHKKKKNNGIFMFLLILTIPVLYFGYTAYKSYKRDKDAPRTYVFANNLFLRSSKVADVEYNRIGSIPYGSELITYNTTDGWSEVKVNGQEGYVSADYTLKAEDFHLLNGIWGNNDAKETVITAKCRLAILDYLKRNNLKTGTTEWQVYTKPKDIKTNNVFFPRLANGYNNFTEFAFILKNNTTQERKLALYSFTEDETPVLVHEENAPQEGEIRNITYSGWRNKYNVSYTNKMTYNGTQPSRKEPQQVEAPNIEEKKEMLRIKSVSFANVDYDNRLLSAYGEPLYTDMKYLKAKIHYQWSQSGTQEIKLQTRLYNPHNTLLKGNGSPIGYTTETTIKLHTQNNMAELTGWGNSEGTHYLNPGIYRYEIWYNGNMLHSSSIEIHQRTIVSDATDETIYDIADKMPEFPSGGMAGLMQYLSKNIKYPTIAQENGTQGRVTVQFVVNRDGSIVDAKVLRGVDPYLDKEAVRLIKGMPKWKPGTAKNGKPIRVRYTVPINFRLQ